MTKHTDLKMPQEYLARWALPIRALDRVGLNILARFTIRWASLERTMRWERWTNWAEVRSPWSPWRSSLQSRWGPLRWNVDKVELDCCWFGHDQCQPLFQKCDPAPFYLFDEIDQALDPMYRKVTGFVHMMPDLISTNLPTCLERISYT